MLRRIYSFRRTYLSMATKIPSLPDVERLSSRVIRITGGNPSKFTLQGTNTYLLGTGPSRILIDTAQGLPAWRASLSSVLAAERCTVSICLLTHWHHDHVQGVDDLLAVCSDATLHKYPLPPPSPPSSSSLSPQQQRWIPHVNFAHEPIADGQTFSVEGARLRTVYSPGHTTDHCGFVLDGDGDGAGGDDSGALFSGDNVLGHGTAVFEDLATYLRSLARMREACGAAARVYPGHGQMVTAGRERIAEYIEHRRKREEEIVAALRALVEGGPKSQGATSMELVKVVYRDVPEHLHEPAEGGLRQVLAKLKGEGRVLEENGRWRLTGKAAL